MTNLDDVAIYERLDPGKMRERIGDLPRQCVDAWRLRQGLDLPEAYRQVRRVVVLGMGGSAIGGALLTDLVADICPVPVLSVGGYEPPAYVGPETLVVASSYSGNTEETLSAFAITRERGSPLLVVTTGGALATLAEEQELPMLRFDYPAAPRAVLGYSFMLLLGLFCHLGLVRDYAADVEEAVAVMEAWQRELVPEVPTARNPAKQMAARLYGRLPVVYGAGFLASVARRWKGQFNENSKNWSFWEELPELNHNAVVGYGLPAEIRDRIMVLFLRSAMDHPRMQARWGATRELVQREQVMVDEAWGRGDSRLAQMLSLIHFGDYVSLYLAVLNGIDPTSVEPIDFLKRRLAEKQRGGS